MTLTMENLKKAMADLKIAHAEFERDCDYLLEEDNLTGRERNEQFLEILAQLEKAEDDCRRAFYEDTKDRNTLENCMLLSIPKLRKISDRYA